MSMPLFHSPRKLFETPTSRQIHHPFKIHYLHRTLEVSLPSTSTVSDLTHLVKIKIQPYLKQRFVCLQSYNNNEIIDYALLQPRERLSVFRRNEDFQIYTCQQPHQKGRRISLSDFVFMKCLGQGGSASVYLVRRRTSGKLYALKQIDKEYFVEFKRMEQILRERKILSEVVKEFPFCARLYSSFESQKHLNFVLEYYPGGELFLHLQRRKLAEAQVKLYFCEIIITFEFLHDKKVVYRDLKPENIMIDYEGHIRLADFGLCKLNLDTQENTYSFCGSLQYMAPEVRNNLGYGYAVDFYTIGAFLYEMLVGIPPFYNNQPLHFPDRLSRHAINLIKGLIEKEPKQRIDSFEYIKKNIWLDGVNWKEVFNKKYEMPLKLSVYESYIHEEFVGIKVEGMNQLKEEKFDGLFSMFEYQTKVRGVGLKTGMLCPKSHNSKSKDSKESSKRSNNHSGESRNSRNSSKKKGIDLSKTKGKPKAEYFAKNVPQEAVKKREVQMYRSLSPQITKIRAKYS